MRSSFVFLILALFHCQAATACPFCSALAISLREEMSLVDHVVIADCTESAAANADLPIFLFSIKKIVKVATAGQNTAEVAELGKELIQVYSHQPFEIGETTLLLGNGKKGNIDWAPLQKLSPLAQRYVDHLVRIVNSESQKSPGLRGGSPGSVPDSIPNADHEFRNLYWDSLESTDDWVRGDAYNALATVSIEQLRTWSAAVSVAEVRSRISRSTTTRRHRRFYWAILGLCGGDHDIAFVRDAIDRQLSRRRLNPLSRDSIGLDAAVSTYLLLGGERAMQEVERLFLVNRERHSSERFAAISALRIHAEDFEAFDSLRICRAMAHLLTQPGYADMVIPDLARLKDWTHVATVKEVFRETSSSHEAARIPIINYLRVCPLPEAVRRARVVFPISRAPNNGS